MNSLRALVSVALCSGGMALSGCAATLSPRAQISEAQQSAAYVPGLPNARAWGDARPAELLAAIGLDEHTLGAGCPKRQTKILALSGGGEDGAFGAGYLVGLSSSKTRPKYDVVTGVSTGALIAPFAFIGEEADKVLTALYTEVSEADIATSRPVLFATAFSDALMDSEPLRKRIEKTVTADFVRKIAAEHKKGRRLLIVTTNLDAQRPVIWNIGEIAQYDSQSSTETIRSVLLASASIPSIFPPVAIPAKDATGQEFREMHVDGGTTMQILAIPEGFIEYSSGKRCGATVQLHAIINGRLDAEFDVVPSATLAIAERSISTLIKTSTRAALTTARALAQRGEIDLTVVSIDRDFEALKDRPTFDREYMRSLFVYGATKGALGLGAKSAESG